MPREIVSADQFNRLDVAWGWDPASNAAASVTMQSADGEQATMMLLDWGDLERLNRAVRRAMKYHRKTG